jgi:heterodisulfide reductase subunit B
MIDFVFISPTDDNQKFIDFLKKMKHAKNCIECYKIRFDYMKLSETKKKHQKILKSILNRECIEKSYSLITLPSPLEAGIYMTAGDNKILKLNGETK